MREERDEPERAAQETSEELEHHGDELGDEIEATKREWERRQDDDSVPGAVPDPDEERADDEPEERAE